MNKVCLKELNTIQPREIVYKVVGERKLRLFVFEPKVQPKSCIINIHGGGWQRETPQRLYPHAAYFSENGGLGICVEYRLMAKDSNVLMCLEDCIDALIYIREWVQINYGQIPLIALGDSAGAYLATCLGCQSIINRIKENVRRVDLVIDLNGIVDLTGKWSYAIDTLKSAGATVLMHEKYSPLFNIKKNDAAVLLMHGDVDEIVDLEDSKRYHKALQEMGIESQLIILSNVNHAFILFDYTHDNLLVADILYKIAQRLKDENFL